MPGWRYSIVLIWFLCSVSCRRSDQAADESEQTVVKMPAQLQAEGLSSLPGALYQSQVASPIRWQPWTKETIERAKSSNRLLFCVIAMPQMWSCQKALSDLAANAEAVSQINDNYIPVLIDGDASREIGLLVPDLCVQIGKSVYLPLLLWMTHECDPMAWIPVQPSNDVVSVFSSSNEMVSQMWSDSMDYVLNNSRLDNGERRKKFQQRKLANAASVEPDQDVIRSIRKLVSLYDPLSRSLDEAGGLFPSSAIEVVAAVANRPGIPEDLRQKSAKVSECLVNDLLTSAMLDPLAGGICISRKRGSWALPNFSFDCSQQARAAMALFVCW